MVQFHELESDCKLRLEQQIEEINNIPLEGLLLTVLAVWAAINHIRDFVTIDNIHYIPMNIPISSNFNTVSVSVQKQSNNLICL